MYVRRLANILDPNDENGLNVRKDLPMHLGHITQDLERLVYAASELFGEFQHALQTSQNLRYESAALKAQHQQRIDRLLDLVTEAKRVYGTKYPILAKPNRTLTQARENPKNPQPSDIIY